MSTATAPGGRVTVSARTVGLATGDLLSILTFVVAGEISHYGLAFVLSSPAWVAETAIPFVLGWLVVAPLAGLYDGTRRSPVRAVGLAVGAWIVAALVGQALRATPYFHGGFAVTFVLVSVLVGAVLIGAWRSAVALVDYRRT